MNISSKGHYALRAIFDLASQNTDRPVKIASIAKRQRIPQKFLELILPTLKQGGFVVSHRGADGGYLLARLPETITVGEVVRFVEGAPPKHGAAGDETPFSELWRDVDKRVAGIVDSVTFATIVRDWTEKQRTYTPDWEI
jgi:Rrf2 family protein